MRNLSMDSIKYMADNADSATFTPYPIVKFNVLLQDKIPSDVLTTFTNKNWVVQFVTATQFSFKRKRLYYYEVN